MAGAKIRLDQLLVMRGLAGSRAKAKALVMAGVVFSGETRLDKAGHDIGVDAPLEVRGAAHPWASRGGVKLAHGLDHFHLDPAGLVCLDIGASAGGFTDVLLSRGAALVYAVDVGKGQLSWKLRSDPRVVALDKTNARNLTSEQIPKPVSLIVCDVSFISLTKALLAPMALASPGACLVALIKPQFEVGKGQVGKKGVVRDQALHKQVCLHIETWLNGQPGWKVIGLCESPIAGADGNKEFLAAAKRGASP